MIKRIFALPALFFALASQAQQNALLDQAFWKASPTVGAVNEAIEKGSDPTERNPGGFDPVVLAINNQAPNQTILHLLTFKGNEVDKRTHDSRIYLHWAASRGNLEIIETLLNKGSNVHAEDSHGSSPLNFAVSGGQKNTAVYDLLLAKGADLKKDLNHDGANALLLAVAQDKDFALTNYFMSKGLNINSTDKLGRTAVDYATRSGNIEHVKAVQAKGAKHTDNALLMAAQGGRGSSANIAFFEYLLSLGIKPAATNSQGENVLHMLVRRPGQNEIIGFFMSKGVDINQQDNEGNNVFMNASATGTIETLAILQPQLKNLDQANKKGVTALALAVRSNSPEVVKWLRN